MFEAFRRFVGEKSYWYNFGKEENGKLQQIS